MLKEGENAGLSSKAVDGPHERGAFPAYNRGVTMGMGNAHPVVLNPRSMTQVLNRLMGHSAFQRMARYQNAAFGLWAPHIYAEYEKVYNTIYSNLELPENFPSVVFTAAAFNFGSDVWTFKHCDSLNWAFGWCAITALGDFDATRSAQIILWELKLVVDFPHAATILLPSTIITHSNPPVAYGDVWTSFTQYTAGAIFCWVENGCRTEEVFEKEDPKGHTKMQGDKSTAYICHLENFSTVDELLAKV
ncbi:hypothetical protein F5051DRAFT_340950 [Lentinula edodes]|nr:hypothetical protein F5051DRAFT_340950 [Lentinula edodes]